ncbi:2'-5' RNA ligase family protein, partial [Amycolatopsis solani]|uniref:2'-5' RNA ligase family protein n=1 Tax=Amycolatopsis solani TaxID=3028615 RepID=UPI0025B01934
GGALDVAAAPLLRLHAELRARWADWLTRQDAQPFKPHVTVQNKVPPEVAAETLAAVRLDPGPRTATATGLDLWHYVGGPWEHLATAPLAGPR